MLRIDQERRTSAYGVTRFQQRAEYGSRLKALTTVCCALVGLVIAMIVVPRAGRTRLAKAEPLPATRSASVSVSLEHDSRGETLIVGTLCHRLSNDNADYPFNGGVIRDDSHASGKNTLEWRRPGRQVQQINLRLLLNHWLKDDAMWGGGLDRHMVTGGMDAVLTEFLPLPNGEALGILNFHYLGSSIPYTEFQFLVKFTANPFKMTVLRRLPGPGVSPYQTQYEDPRLYTWKNRLYCIDKDAIELIDSNGKSTARLCDWHAVPLGICNGRWIIGIGLAPSQRSEATIIAVDLKTGRSQTIFTYRSIDVNTQKGWEISGPDISDDSPYLLFHAATNPNPSRSSSERIQRSFTLRMPDGVKANLEASPGQFSVGEYVVARGTSDRFRIWSAATGQLVRTYP